jgi:hypothetical protein
MTLTLGRLLFTVKLNPSHTYTIDPPPNRQQIAEQRHREDLRLADAGDRREGWYLDMMSRSGRLF